MLRADSRYEAVAINVVIKAEVEERFAVIDVELVWHEFARERRCVG